MKIIFRKPIIMVLRISRNLLFNHFPIKIFFALASSESIVALILLFRVPSMERNSVLFGFSLLRLVIGGALSSLFLDFCSYWQKFFLEAIGSIHKFLFSIHSYPKVIIYIGFRFPSFFSHVSVSLYLFSSRLVFLPQKMFLPLC